MINVKYSRPTDWVWLFIGIALTVVYIVFADPMYNAMFYGSDGFADTMYDYNMYFIIALISSIVAWLIAIIYYVVVDSVKLSSFLWWFCCLLITCIIVMLLTVYIPDSQLMENNIDFIGDLWWIGWINVPISLFLYVIASLSLKNLSSNCSTRPF